MSQLDAAIRYCGMFEAELLVDLMLRFWAHPSSGEREAVNYLVESATEILIRAKSGEVFIEGIEPKNMNFVAAVWYAEYCHAQDSNEPDVAKRRDWLRKVRHALPSCFCDPDDLDLPTDVHGSSG